jgi:hypothetical protein
MAVAKHNVMPRVSKEAGSKFIAQLLAPVPAADLEDRNLVLLEERAKRAAKSRAEDVWRGGINLVHEAEHLLRAACFRRLIDRNDAADANLAKAQRRYDAEVARQMRIPAALIRHLRWKEKMQNHGGKAAEVAPLIAADKARLEGAKA